MQVHIDFHGIFVWDELTIDDQDGCWGGHRGYRNKMFLAILNLHVVPMPPTKFWLNLTCHSGADEVWRFSRWPPWGASQIISDQNDFSNSESLCSSYASYQVWAQSRLCFGRCYLKNKMAITMASLDVGIEQIKHFWISISPVPPTNFSLIWLTVTADFFSRFSSWPAWRSSWILEWNEFSNSKLPCHSNASTQIDVNSTDCLGADIVWRFSRWPVATILEIGTKQI